MSKTTETMQAFGAAFSEAFRQRDLKIALLMSKWARNMHVRASEDFDTVCLHCRSPWPCRERLAADERVSELSARIVS